MGKGLRNNEKITRTTQTVASQPGVVYTSRLAQVMNIDKDSDEATQNQVEREDT